MDRSVGGGFGRTFKLGEQAVKAEVDGYYNAIRPEAGNETWLLQVTLTLVFPTDRLIPAVPHFPTRRGAE